MKRTIGYILVICLLFASAGSVLAGCKNTGEVTSDVTSDVTPEVTPVTPDETPDEAPPTVLGTVDEDDTGKEKNSRRNPAQVNETVVYDTMRSDYNACKLEITLLEVLRGGGALKILKQADNYNQMPPHGKEYLLAKFRVTALESKNDASILLTYDFDIVSGDGRVYTDHWTVVDGIDKISSMYAGATQEGYLCFLVDENDEEPLIVYPIFGTKQVWFSGKQTAGSEYDDYSPLGDPNRPGSKNNPAKLNETASFNGFDLADWYHSFDANITITELSSGQRALDMILNADEYNKVPLKGQEYLIVKLEVEAIASRDERPIDIDYGEFCLVNEKGMIIGEWAYVWGFDRLWYYSIDQGDVLEEYLVYLVDKSESDRYIVAFSESEAPVWFYATQSDREPLSDPKPGDDLSDEAIKAWALGCSVIQAVDNSRDPFQFGMYKKTADNAIRARALLTAAWNVYDRDGVIMLIESPADSELNSAYASFSTLLALLPGNDYRFLLEFIDVDAYDFSAEDIEKVLERTIVLMDKWGEKQLKALTWFYMIQIAGLSYVAGYFDLQEAYDYMRPVIADLRSTFSSWDEAVDNYLDGFAWALLIDVNEPDTDYKHQLDIYEGLKSNTALYDPTVWD